jgi:hypothetical protein
MIDTQLSLPERAVLLALSTFVGEVSNNDLRERYGFALDGKDRIRLAECGYVSSRRSTELPGRPFVHELTDLGWRRARQEFDAGAPANATKGYRLLYGVLNCFARYMAREDRVLADVVLMGDVDAKGSERSSGVQMPEPIVAETRIRVAYADLVDKPGVPVRLLSMRERLGDLPSEEFDAALIRLAHERGVFLEPEPKLRSLTDADRRAAVRVGGEAKHLLSIEPS